jgi:LAO/AO transport system kinase
MTPNSPSTYVEGVKAGNRRLLAKAITLVESRRSDHQALARMILDPLLPRTGKAARIGITGVPGVGKSTFIESFGTMLINQGHRVAVLAVDPSSSRSGGSVLADKTRMEQLSVNSGAYIRPSPAGDTLGGVAARTRETMLLCEAAGFDVVIVETVGVGQSETAVANMVDFFLVLMLAGAGDELQGIKKGVLELADAVAVNKADGDNIERAIRARQSYETALHFMQPATTTWSPPVLTCSAKAQTGISEIWNCIKEYRKKLTATGELDQKRRDQALAWMWTLVEQGLTERLKAHPAVKAAIDPLSRAVARGETSPMAAAGKLLFLLDNP